MLNVGYRKLMMSTAQVDEEMRPSNAMKIKTKSAKDRVRYSLLIFDY